ncbi:MAG: hypothetical protein HDR07_01880 [Lachnospiraceae bacterium]|nr:hypothetical protein [Lachnospiraceae bacterium]
MIQLLFFLFICIVIYRNVQRAKESNDTKSNNAGSNTMTNQPGANARPAAPVNRNTQMAKASKQTATVVKPAVKETKEDGKSTTEYLKEKAEEDARQHAKEKFEEQKRLYETRGGLAVAERYLDGDLIPQGKRCVKCGYCGAENLVPMQPRTRYSCYFCREALS